MKTEDLLNLDCSVEENKQTLNKFLWKIKPVKKLLEKDGYSKSDITPLEVLEKALHGIKQRYSYKDQGISMYYEDGKFKFYTISVMKKTETVDWIGNIYGLTLWETIAKELIKIYGEILKEKKQNEQ